MNVSRTSKKSSLLSLALAVGLPVLTLAILSMFYHWRTELPNKVVIAGGPEGGRYLAIAKALARELTGRHGIQVDVLKTGGSMENLELVRSGQADFGMYQEETMSVLGDRMDEVATSAMFVGNIYPEFLMPVIRNGYTWLHVLANDEVVWACNDRASGDYAMTRWLIDHLGASTNNVRLIDYSAIPNEIDSKQIEVGVICCGIDAPILPEVLQNPSVSLVGIPAVEALARRHPALSVNVIPEGYFQTQPPLPKADTKTITLEAQLLAGEYASVRLVEEVTSVLLDPGFQRSEALTELARQGKEYAIERSEFEIHPGASHVYYPELKPLLNPDFVEGTEGLRSFVVSFAVAIWLFRRWWIQRQVRSQEHRLDRYIRRLLEIEVEQMDIDGEGGAEEGEHLQKLLDQVTILRQEALREFTAHELNEDRAVECFVGMCHALSEKVNSKLTRHTILHLNAT